jgi:hypothetical protein
MDYFIFDESALNTFSEVRAAQIQATTRYRLLQTIAVSTRTLASLLAEYVPPGQRVNLLTVDTEGSDLEVLRSNDWSRFRPEMIIAEDLNQYRLLDIGESDVVRFLEGVQFEAVAKTMNSIFFVERDHE